MTTLQALTLLLAFAGPPAIAAAALRSAAPVAVRSLAADLALVLLAAALVAVALGPLGLPPQALGFTSPTLATLPLALLFTAGLVGLWGPLAFRLAGALGKGFGEGLARLDEIPRSLRLVAVLVVAPVEEVLYRAVGLALLVPLVGAVPALVVSSVLFGLAHAPLWGWPVAMVTMLSGAILGAFYLASGDLWAVMLAHVATDLVGLLRRR